MSNVTEYTPPGTLKDFLTSPSIISLVTGPVGSGKSSAAMLKIAYHAMQMKKGKDGIRRSRCVVVRNTVQMLKDATYPTFTTWFPAGIAGEYAKSEGKFYLKFGDTECEVLLRGLDDADDVRRLLSLEVSFGVIDEFREIHPDIFNALQGRIGRFPSMKDGGCVDDAGKPNYHLWGASNSPDYGSFWEEYLTNPPANANIFRQPSALSDEADWAEHLIPGYYENLAEGKTDDWIRVFIHNEFGLSLSGKPVHASFKRDTHVSKTPLKFNLVASNPLIVGMDTALHPAATIGQIDYKGKLLIYGSMHAADMGALRFVRERLKPVLNARFPGAKTLVVIDPAGMQRSQSDETTVADILRAEGFMCMPAKTNSIAARIAAVDSYLTRMVDGSPGIQFDQEHNSELILALSGKYRYRVKTNGDTDDKPDKQRPWADLVDSLQYLCLHADGGALFGTNRVSTVRKVLASPYAYV